MSARTFLRRRIGDPILHQLTQGISAEKIALTVAVGLTIAVNPVVGTTTILCFLAAWALRLNQPIIQAINWSSYALQLALIFPFIRLGERILGAPRENRPPERLVAMMKADALGTLADVGTTLGHAVVAWVLVAPLLVGSIYFAVLPIVRSLGRRGTAGRAKDVDHVA